MKLKIYRISLLFMLFLSLMLTLILGIKSTISIINNEQITLIDGIIYMACYLMLLIFIGLEIFNTILSFKHGSMYAKPLAYNDDNTINRNSLIIIGGIINLSMFAVIYIMIILIGYPLPLHNLDKEALLFMIPTFATVFVNSLFILLFPLLAKNDQSLNN